MSSQETSHKAGDFAGQAQMKKDEMINKASDAGQSASQSLRGTKDEAGGFLQQTGEKMMSTAHGAADSVKSTLGIGKTNN